MKIKLALVFALMIGAFIRSEGQTRQTIRSVGTIRYWEYLPPTYSQTGQKIPVVIFLHGKDQRGTTEADMTKILSLASPPKYVEDGIDFPFVLISPQLKTNYGSWNISQIDAVLEDVKRKYNIDSTQIYLTGLSLGGGGVWGYAQDPVLNKKIRGIAPVCGSQNNTLKACNIVSQNIRVWAFHGRVDTTVPVNISIRMVNAINACGSNPPAILTIYENINHNAWDKAYRVDNSLHTPNLYEWIMQTFNYHPTANAGADKIVSQAQGSATIAGSGTDIDGTIQGYLWEQTSGAPCTMTGTTTANLMVSGLTDGVYKFNLIVTDNKDAQSQADEVVVTVTAGNVAPVANAGPDKTITLPQNSVILSGSGTDADGSIQSYAWQQTSGGTCTLSNANTNNLSVSGLTEGVYSFALIVTDNGNALSSPDEVVATVSANTSPVANAGPDKLIKLPTTSATLFGSGTDSDGTIVSYQWIKVSGGTINLSNPAIARPVISSFSSGSFVFRLTVTDNKGATSSDEVTVVASYPPTANAGIDQTIFMPSTSATLTGSGSDSDGTIVSYTWQKVSEPENSVITTPGNATTSVTSLSVGSYVYKLTVKDNAGLTSIDTIAVNVLNPAQARTPSNPEVVEVNKVESQNLVEVAKYSGVRVVIFDGTGKKLHDGIWNESLIHERLREKTLYFINVYPEGGKVKSGKFILKQ